MNRTVRVIAASEVLRSGMKPVRPKPQAKRWLAEEIVARLEAAGAALLAMPSSGYRNVGRAVLSIRPRTKCIGPKFTGDDGMEPAHRAGAGGELCAFRSGNNAEFRPCAVRAADVRSARRLDIPDGRYRRHAAADCDCKVLEYAAKSDGDAKPGQRRGDDDHPA